MNATECYELKLHETDYKVLGFVDTTKGIWGIIFIAWFKWHTLIIICLRKLSVGISYNNKQYVSKE